MSLCAAMIMAAASAEADPLITEGAIWNYYKGTNTPVVQGTTTWTVASYNDSTWATGASGFGNGDSDDATVLGDMQSAGYWTVFTRRRFVIANTAAVTHLTLAADYDDGFVAYVNGQEVARRTMPAGPADHTTFASGNHEASRAGQDDYNCGCDPQEKEFIALDPSLLVNGTNVLAVSGHNISQSSTDFSLIMELYTNITLVRGPLLQMPQPRRITVTWRTDALTDSVVDYGADTNYGLGTVTDTNLARDHVVDLPELAAGSTYFYRVRSGGLTLAADRFRSPASAQQSFRFAAIGDFGSSSTNTPGIARKVRDADPDFILTVGDNMQQNSGPPGLFDSHWFGPYSNVYSRAPLMPALGNHDIRVGNGDWELLALTLPTNGPPGLLERNYSYDYGNAHFTVIDANAFAPDGESAYTNEAAMRAAILLWLTNDLAQTTQQWKFVHYHQPPYTSQGLHGDEELMKSMVSPILEKYGVHIAFQGHNHLYERINPINGVNYITVGSGGFSINTLTGRRIFSALVFNDRYDFVVVDVDGPHLSLRCVDQAGVERDSFRLDLDHPFRMDGLLDSTNWVRASNGLVLSAAIRGYHLYAAMQDAGEGSDHFIFLNNTLTTSRPANWAKSGSNMQWSAFLADEQAHGYHAWFNASDSGQTNFDIYRDVTSGLNDNGTNGNGVLEGTIQLLSHFGSFPTQVFMAGAPYGNADGGSLVAVAQVPAGDGNTNISPDEYLPLLTRDIALDLPMSEAGSNQTVEAGMAVALSGVQSSVPSGLPPGYLWTQTGGATVLLNGATTLIAGFTFTNNVGGSTNLVFQLTVSDPRFASNDTVVVTVQPLVDTDGDGLSDQEEASGADNVLTAYNPGGHHTDSADSDSDDDGSTDGEESMAGTVPTNAQSVLQVAETKLEGTNVVIRWSSVSNRLYSIYEGTNFQSPPSLLVSGLTGLPPVNAYTTPAPLAVPSFHFIQVESPSN